MQIYNEKPCLMVYNQVLSTTIRLFLVQMMIKNFFLHFQKNELRHIMKKSYGHFSLEHSQVPTTKQTSTRNFLQSKYFNIC